MTLTLPTRNGRLPTVPFVLTTAPIDLQLDGQERMLSVLWPSFIEGSGSVVVQTDEDVSTLTRDLTIASMLLADPTAGVSLVTEEDGAECEVVGIATSYKADQDPATILPPTFTMVRRNERLAVWLLNSLIRVNDTRLYDRLSAINQSLNKDGTPLSDLIPLPGAAGWDTRVNGDRYSLEDLEKAFSVLYPATDQNVEKTTIFNDARIHGDLGAEFLTRTIQVGLTTRGAEAKKWRNIDMQLGALVAKLSEHKVGPKDGPALLQGAVIEGERKAQAISHLDLVILDMDTGEDIDRVIASLKELGLFAVVYSTHSHLKPVSEVPKDRFLKWSEGAEPTAAGVARYFQEERRYQPEILTGADLLPTEHTKDGIMVRLKHQPMPKFRVLLVLKDRFVMADRKGATHKEAITEWKERYAGVATLLGATFDRSCVDPSRLMYLPRHPEGAEFRIDILAGKALDLDAVERVNIRYLAKGEASQWEQAATAMGGGRDDKTYKTGGLLRFFAKKGDRFEMVDFLEAHLPDGDRGDRSGKPGRHWRCPNDDAHSNAGDSDDKGFFCVNASDSDNGAVAKCMHDSCSQLDRIDFVDMVCAEAGIDQAIALETYVVEVEGDHLDAELAACAPERTSESSLTRGKSLKAKGDGGRWWVLTPDGFHTKETEGQPPRFICAEFKPIARMRDEHGENWCLLIEFKNHAGTSCTASVPLEEIAGDHGRMVRSLANRGFPVGSCPNDKMNVARLFREASPPDGYSLSAPGWQNDNALFMAPTGEVVGSAGGLSYRLANGAGAECRETSGTLEGWSDAVRAAHDGGMHFVIGALTGFVGPLLQLVDANSCGLVFSGKSSRGKSTAQGLGASVWANPKARKGVLHPLKATLNALESLACVGNGCVLALDEAGQGDDKDLGRLIFSLTSGASKARQTVSGELRKGASWATFFTLSSELGVRELIERSGRRYLPGMAARFPDVCVAGAKDVDMTTMARINAFKLNYGHAGPKFVKHLIDSGLASDPARIKTLATAALEAIIGDDPDGARRRAAEVFALLQVAGELAQVAGAFPPEVNVVKAVKDAWEMFQYSDEIEALDDVHVAIDNLRFGILSNWDVTIKSTEDAFNPQRSAKAWYNDEDIMLPKNYLVELSGSVTKLMSLQKALHEQGLLNKNGAHYLHKYAPGLGKVPHFRLSKRAFAPSASFEDGARMVGYNGRDTKEGGARLH